MKTFPKYPIALAFLFLFIWESKAQCPPASSSRVHVVQKGETLWRISKKYGLSVDEVARMNNIHQYDNLNVCQELIVSSGSSSQNSTPPASAPTEAKPQGGKTHTVRRGETIADIAYAYGYTEERFRRFNGLDQNEKAWRGMVLKTGDCDCPTYQDGNGSSVVDRPSNREVPETEVRPYQPTTRPGSTSPSNSISFREDPFGEEESSRNSWQPATYTPSAYDSPEERKTTQPTRTTTTRRDNTTPRREFMPADEQLADNKSNSTTRPSSNTNTSSGVTKDAAKYMTAEEIEMVNEINLVRSNPKGYVKYIEDYKSKVAAGKAFGSVETCDELIRELKKTPRLSVLKPTECIYRAAKKHGQDQRPTGDVDHQGTDGSYPWDRVRRECPNMSDGNENIVAGPSAVRDAVIILLVDDGIPNRGHRRTMLNPEWNYAACYKVGQVGNMPNNWVQKYGK